MTTAAPLLHLIVQYCQDPRPERQAEFDACLAANLDNPWVITVHNLVEPHVVVPQRFATHAKYSEHRVPDWLTYQRAFQFANQQLDGEVVAVTNLDIMLDPATDWAAAAALVQTREQVLCLGRHETDGQRVWRDEALARLAFANSQDAWLFRAPALVLDCDFEVGTLGCDNAIAERIKRSGLTPVNAGQRFRVLHLDAVRGKSGGNARMVHGSEGRRTRHPEEQGQYLLPDLDMVTSIDQLMQALGLGEMDRYRLACDLVSSRFKITNR